ncbi:MAG: hypothetical protein UR83_C0006G0037 [Candidatus Moranbacteria bacterium GW2011_GWF2_35_54]|nr:MAG: hypothetical protein UR83_C0006G0037 [Candidatus Moranbacteria bacterium GW2011_GWF2_35_54]
MEKEKTDIDKKLSRAEAFGIESADAIMEAAHMTYNRLHSKIARKNW